MVPRATRACSAASRLRSVNECAVAALLFYYAPSLPPAAMREALPLYSLLCAWRAADGAGAFSLLYA